MVLLIVFGLLAVAAVYATWHDDDLQWVGLLLAAGFILSNWMHAEMHVTSLPGPYSLIEVIVLVATFVAWDSHRRYWGLLVLGGINVLSICANIAFLANFPPAPRHIFLFELTTNICFGLECLLALGAGIADGLRVGRFPRLLRRGGGVVAPDAVRTSKGAE